MTPLQRYAFDVNGYVVLRGVLDEAEVTALRTLLETRVADLAPHEKIGTGDRSLRFTGFLPWGEVVRRLLDHPSVTEVLNGVIGRGSGSTTTTASTSRKAPDPSRCTAEEPESSTWRVRTGGC